MSEWITFDGIALSIALASAVTAFCAAWGAFGIDRLWDYSTLVLLLVVLVIALAGANNVLLFYVMWEVTAFAAWGLGRWAGEGPGQTMMGPLPLQGFGALGSLSMSVALVLLAVQNRSLALHGLDTTAVGMITALVLLAIVLKSFALLSSAWYPSRDERSFFAGHAVVASAGLLGIGLYPYLRLLFDNLADHPEWRQTALVAGLGIAFLTALAALGEYDLHKVLAYATLSQLGGLIAFFALIRAGDVALSVLAVLAYAPAIAALTLCLGVVAAAAGQRDLRRMGGLAGRMPVTAGLFLACSLSLAGLPPLAGFAGRLFGAGVLFGREDTTAAYLFFALGALTLIYLLRLFRAIFLGAPGRTHPAGRGASPVAVAAGGLLVLVLLFVGMLPAFALDLLAPVLDLSLK